MSDLDDRPLTTEPESFLRRALSGLNSPDSPDTPASQDQAGAYPDGAACPACGATRAPEWAFCGSCGGPVPTFAIEDRLAPETAFDDDAIEGTAPLAAFGHDGSHRDDSDEVAASRHVPTTFGLPSGAETRETPEGFAPAAVRDNAALVPQTEHRRAGVIAAAIALVLIMTALAAFGTVGWNRWSSSQEALAATQGRLDKTSNELAFANDTLDRTRDQLDRTKGSLNESQSELDDVRSQLDKSRGSLTNAQDRLDLQASQIDTLQTCLNGVSEALSSVASGYYGDAVSSLRAVQSDCEKANNIL